VKLSEELLTSEKAKGDLDAKRRLMMYISHEIRTPLSIVNFGFQLIKSQLTKLEVLHEEEGIGRGVPVSSASSRCTSPLPDLLSKCTSPELISSMTTSPAQSTDPSPDVSSRSNSSIEENIERVTMGGVQEVEKEYTQKMIRHGEIRNTICELDSITSDSAHSVEVAISILNDLLNYEKLQTNVLEMFKEYVPSALVKAVIDEFHVEASYFKVNLSFKTEMSFEDQGNTFMWADKQKFSQVVRNFVSNALKFTPEGGSVIATVTLQPLEEGKEQETKTSKEGKTYVECGVLHVGIRDTG
jgi:signal transduction histidine kinase